MLRELIITFIFLAIGIWVINQVIPDVTIPSIPIPTESSILLQKQVDITTKEGAVHIYPQTAKCSTFR
jgi:hypothetical protein